MAIHKILIFSLNTDPPESHVRRVETFNNIINPQSNVNSKTGDQFQTFSGKADLNGDGDADAIQCIEGPLNRDQRRFACIFSDAKLEWYFAFSATRDDRPLVKQIRIGDVEGDGDMDVTFQLVGGGLVVLENTNQIQEVEVPDPPSKPSE